MKLKQFIDPARVDVGVSSTGEKEALFHGMLRPFAEEFGDEGRAAAVKALLAREKVGTTGIGGGIALPHATVPVSELKETRIYVAVSRDGLDFQALDEEPVFVIFMIVSPTEDVKVHIGILARIARLFTNSSFIHKLRDATSPKEVYDLLMREDGSRL